MIRRAALFIFCAFFLSGCCDEVFASVKKRPPITREQLEVHPQIRIIRAVMNEAEGEDYISKLMHACVFRNRLRAGLSLGSSGLDSLKVKKRLARASAVDWQNATVAVENAFQGTWANSNDTSSGAIYCENVRKFGVPLYIEKGLRAGTIEECARRGDVIFWRDKKVKKFSMIAEVVGDCRERIQK